MTETHGRRFAFVLGGGLSVLFGLAVLFSVQPGAQRPVPPSIDLSGVESAVAEGLTDARQAVIDSPDSAECWSQLAMTWDAHEYTREALACYAVAARLAPQDARWPYLAGTLLYASDREAALQAFQRACDLAPQSALYRVRLGEACLDAADLAMAEQHLQAALRIEATDSRVQFRLAQLRLAEGDATRALELAEAALAGRPRHRAILQLLVTVQGRLGTQSEPSFRKYQTLLREETDVTDGWPDPVRSQVQLFRLDSWWLAGQGEDRLEVGDVNGSLALLREALERSPKNTVFRARLANALLQSGQLDEAKQVLADAPSRQAEQFDLVRMAGTIAMYAEGWPLAAENLRVAVRQKPDSAALLADLGFALRQSGRLSGAVEELTRSVRIDPRSAATWQQLVETLIESKESEKALQEVERGLRSLPDDSTLLALKKSLSE